MSTPRMTPAQLQEIVDLVQTHGSVFNVAKATGEPRTTLQARYDRARVAGVTPSHIKPHHPAHVSGQMGRRPPEIPETPPRRHVYIPDTQVRPGVPTDHIDWIAADIVRRKPDVIVVGGDFWDFPSLNTHNAPGSAPTENARYQADLDSGNIAFARLCLPIEKEQERDPLWRPRKVFTEGNHENRADRAAIADPKWMGHVGSNNCQVRDFEWHSYLRRVKIDDIIYAHFFPNPHSRFPVGGSVDNRLNKIGASFVQGHEQGFKYGTRITGAGVTWHGIVAGSCYLHIEDYRGAQGQKHFRGIIYLNEVREGDFCIMPLTLDYLCRKATGTGLYRYMIATYPDGDWEHLR